MDSKEWCTMQVSGGHCSLVTATLMILFLAFPRLLLWLSWQRICLQYGKPGFDPWVGKIPLEKGMATHSTNIKIWNSSLCLDVRRPDIHEPYFCLTSIKYSLVGTPVKNLLAMWETWVQSLGRKDPLEKGMATHTSILTWGLPRTEEPGRLQSLLLQSQTWLKWLNTHTCIYSFSNYFLI